MPIRVIAGSAKGRKLKLVPGDSTRPIMDRVKEALFSILGSDIVEARFLDLFAGTGSVGIEALSRGAQQVTFVERDRVAAQTIRENLEHTRLAERAVIRRADVLAFLQQTPQQPPFDYIFLAPPQYKGLWLETLKRIDANPAWLSAETQVIVQIDPSEHQDFWFTHLTTTDRRIYGKTELQFIMKKDSIEGPGDERDGTTGSDSERADPDV
jgi:16S rRNA (guanine(966)-N(2))-methyltransferase RsmD